MRRHNSCLVAATTWVTAGSSVTAAVRELAIRDLKAGAGLAHLPSGRFAANAAWLLAATLAHNLLRWTASLGLGSRDQQTVAKTLRRTLLVLPGRLTRSARRPTLHLPAGWLWAHSFTMALAPTAPACPSRRRKDHPAAQPPAGHPHPPHPAAPPSRNATVRTPRPARVRNGDCIRGSVDPGSDETAGPVSATIKSCPHQHAQIGAEQTLY
jgi:hypothetical protein